MKTEHVQLALAIAREGSISQAAKSLYLTQPTASTMLKSLETELGFTVFERTRTGMELTAVGAEFIGYASGIERLVDAIAQIRHPKKYVGLKALSIGFPFAEQAFGQICEEFCLDTCVADFAYNVIGTTEEALRLLDQGVADVAVVTCRKALFEAVSRNVAKARLASEVIGYGHLELTCVLDHEIIRDGAIHYDLFGSYPSFSSIHKADSAMYAPDFLIAHSIEISSSIDMDPSPVRMGLLQRLRGYLISLPMGEEVKRAYGLTSVAIEDTEMAIFAIYRKGTATDDLITRYIDVCRQLFPWEKAVRS